jgi:AbrB family looped-hinge helix DNA binding protein
MVARVKVSSKNQIAVPAEVRRELKIKPGDTLLVTVVGGHAVLMPEPADYVAAMRGLGAEVWRGEDAQEYVNRERDAWEE